MARARRDENVGKRAARPSRDGFDGLQVASLLVYLLPGRGHGISFPPFRRDEGGGAASRGGGRCVDISVAASGRSTTYLAGHPDGFCRRFLNSRICSATCGGTASGPARTSSACNTSSSGLTEA